MTQQATGLDAQAGFQAYKAQRRFGNLDGLRFICIAMVIWHHLPKGGLELPQLLTRGFLGVDFFFVLSGYLITTLLLREAETTGRMSLKNFYIRRLLRILPVYFFIVTCVAAYYILVQGQTELLHLLPYYYLFLSNFLTEHIPLLTITWSLSVEEQYYMLWPLLLLLLPMRWIVPISLLVVAANVLGGMGIFGNTPPQLGPLALKLPNSTYAPIVLGSLVAIMLNSAQGFAMLHRIAASKAAALVGLVLLCLVFHFGAPDVRGLTNLVIHLLMSYVLVALVIREDTILSPVLKIPLIARVGVVSYGIYLYHLIALDLVKRVAQMLDLDVIAFVLPTYFVLAYLMAELSFRTLEAYFQRFRPRG